MNPSSQAPQVIDTSDNDDLWLRLATLDDLDGITQLAIDAFPDDPERDYRFPFRHEFPDDHWTWTRVEYQGYLEQPHSYDIMVVEAVAKPTGAKKIVALGIWDVSHLTCRTPNKPSGVLGDNQRRDANLPRMRYFKARVEQVFQMHLSQYGEKQVHLVNLATHRAYRRRGCGAALCRWGMEKAERKGEGWVATVFGSPMGKRLYISQGFKVVGAEPLRLPGDDEELTVTALVYQGLGH